MTDHRTRTDRLIDRLFWTGPLIIWGVAVLAVCLSG